MKKRLWLGLALAIVGICSVAAGAAQAHGSVLVNVPRTTQALTGPAAKHYTRVVLSNKFTSWNNASGRHVGSCKKLSRIRQRCKVSWFIGDGSYSGHVTIAFRKGNKTQFFYTTDIKVLDEYCVVQGGTKAQCSHHVTHD